jgi:dTMP kinase
MFVSIEGIDYSGKSTVTLNVSKELGKKGYEVKMIWAPGFTFAGQKLRRILCGEIGKTLTVEAQVLLFIGDFVQTYETIIQPALQEGQIVISDRWVDSTFVYQISQIPWKDNLLKERLLDTIDTFVEYPDLTVILDVTVDDALRRMELDIKRRRLDKSHFEDVELSVWDARVEAYRSIPRNNTTRNFVERDGGMPLQGIVDDLVEIISSTYEDRRKR